MIQQHCLCFHESVQLATAARLLLDGLVASIERLEEGKGLLISENKLFKEKISLTHTIIKPPLSIYQTSSQILPDSRIKGSVEAVGPAITILYCSQYGTLSIQ